MSSYIPLIELAETIREDGGDVVRVWYRVSSPSDAKSIFPWRRNRRNHQDPPEIVPGNWLVLLARVHSVRSSGGYTTGTKPPGSAQDLSVEKLPINPGVEFRFERAEIFLLPKVSVPKDSQP